MPIEPIQTAPKPKTSWLPWLICAVVIGITVYGKFRKPDNPGPQPPVEVRQLAQDCTATYIRNLSAGQTALADEVESGAITNRRLYLDRSAAISKAARDEAFRPLFERENEVIPNGQWDESQRAEVAKHTREVADGQLGAIQ